MKISTIIALVIGVVCVVAIVTSLFSAGKLIKIAYDKLLGVSHNCYYYPTPTKETEQPKCQEDKAQTRREIADSAALLTVSLPLAIFAGRRLWKLKEAN